MRKDHVAIHGPFIVCKKEKVAKICADKYNINSEVVQKLA
jgi:hypothetical protein